MMRSDNSEPLEELMRRYKLGDYQAFKELYSKVSPILYGYLIKKLKNESTAGDVLQEVFAKLHISKNQYNSEYPLMPWLFTVCRTSLMDYFRKESKFEKANEAFRKEPPTESEEVETYGVELISQFKRILTEDQFLALNLRYVDGLEFKEIAKKIGTSQDNSRKLVSRAIQKIKTRIKI